MKGLVRARSVWFCFGSFVFVAASALAYPSVRAQFSGYWSADQKNLLRFAARRAVTRMFDEDILECAKDAAHKNFPSRTEWRRIRKLQDDISVASIEIKPLDLSCPVVGRVTTGRAYIDYIKQETDGFGRDIMKFEIKLNDDCIGDHADRHNSTNADFWAGVIAHELGHNIGLKHPSGYPGSFLREWERCVEHDGEWEGSNAPPMARQPHDR